MKLVRYSPWRDLDRLEDRFSRMIGLRPAWWESTEGFGTWCPAVDVYETEKDFVVKAELPEFEKKDVHVSAEGNTLTITGERKAEREVKEEDYHRRERFVGSFTRSFVVPDTVDIGKIRANFKDGILKLELPKREEAKPKEITIQAA